MIAHPSDTHNLSSCETKARKEKLNIIQTHDLCNASALLYQLII